MADSDLDKWLGASAAPIAKTGTGSPAPSAASLDAWLQAGAQNGASAQAPTQAPQYSGALRLPAIAGSSALAGAAQTLGIPGDLEAWGASHLPPALTRTNAFNPASPTQTVGLPTSAQLTGLTDSTGLTNRPDLAPGQGANPETERLLAATASGVGSAAPMLLTGGAALPTLLTGGASGLAGEGAHELFPGSQAAPIAAGLAAGTGAQGLLAAVRAGSISRLASELGTSSTVQESGQAVQSEARNWLTTTKPQALDAIWQHVNSVIPASAPTPLTHFESTLAQLAGKGGDYSNLHQAFSNSTASQIKDILDNKTPMGVGVAPSWANAHEISRAIGDMQPNPKYLSQDQLDALYGALAQDRQAVAQAHGVGAEFSAANLASKHLYDFQDRVVDNLVSGPKASGADPNPENVASQLLSAARKGGSSLSELRNQMPGAVDELGAGLLRTNPQTWLKLSPEAQAALVVSPTKRAILDQLAEQAKPESSLDRLGHTVQLGIGAAVGPEVADALGLGAGHGLLDAAQGAGANALVPHLIGLGAGIVAPTALRGAKAVVTRPGTLRLPATGAIAGANDLAVQQQ